MYREVLMHPSPSLPCGNILDRVMYQNQEIDICVLGLIYISLVLQALEYVCVVLCSFIICNHHYNQDTLFLMGF